MGILRGNLNALVLNCGIFFSVLIGRAAEQTLEFAISSTMMKGTFKAGFKYISNIFGIALKSLDSSCVKL